MHKSESYDTRKKDMATKHVSINKTNADEATGLEHAQMALQLKYDDFSKYFALFDQEVQN